MALPRMPFLRRIACLVPIAVIGVLVALNWPLVASGGRGLLTANRYWLLAALAVTALGWVAVSFARQGAVLEPLPARRLFATQFASGAANHLLPAGLGAGAVNLRFLRGCGIPLTRSSAALALYLLAEAAVRLVLLLTLLAAFPDALRLDGLLPQAAALPLVWAAGGLLCTALLALIAIRPLRRAVAAFAGTALTDARALHARPTRALALWGGSLAFPVLQAAGLVAVALALDVPVPVIHVAIAYLSASIAAAAVPTPGGIGSVDAALVIALVAAGASVTAAGSVVLGYRIITVWLPLIPGALVLGALVRSKVI
ncbi:lysylphosphatidylglycerol synthase transmembrane domain-containing protein [Streptomyces sp. NBC_01217]|uniref:lysylphosphatidylglycerol synthase transmembrane domain-containing protein n=1 Tax=Streptomyces sp. NBC_01217 TaxID=2903779 RepID=UPI002E0F8EA0|nr:flippase-like domain-containing protein [Streptomyces sp. NBC_01217]